MKKNSLLNCICIIASLFSYSQIINIPDANFKNRLLMASSSLGIAQSNWTYSNQFGTDITIDVNQDGEIQQSEALAVSYLAVPDGSISDLTGIEYFTNLHGIQFANNTISTVNLSALTQLEVISGYNNQLTSLDLTGLINLKRIICWNNQISSLNFTGLSTLKIVYCGHNLLTSLDFSNNPLFEDLGCEYNPNLTTIKIKNNHTQLYGSQTRYNQCWGGNPNLNYICADAVEIPGLQSFLASCNFTQAITIDSACDLGVEGFSKSEVGVFPNPVQNKLNIANEEELQYELFSILGAKIQAGSLAIHGQVDCSGLAKGLYLLKLNKDNGESKVVKVVKE